MRRWVFSITILICAGSISAQELAREPIQPLVLFTDFGTSERFVASMKGVAVTVDRRLQIFDLTHDIEPQNIFQASFVLNGTIEYWPEGTVFVAVIDPGVGTSRKSVVAKTGTGHYIVTPDNGTLTFIADTHKIVAMREIDESVNRRPGTEDLHTFHGRDVYTYTGARLAAGVISFEGVGPELPPTPQRFDYAQPHVSSEGVITGQLINVERPFGNIVTNIPKTLMQAQGLEDADNRQIEVRITNGKEVVFDGSMPYANSFGFVGVGEPLVYADSQETVGLAVRNGDFAKTYKVGAGAGWSIRLTATTPAADTLAKSHRLELAR